MQIDEKKFLFEGLIIKQTGLIASYQNGFRKGRCAKKPVVKG